MLILSIAPANLCTECLYAVCEEINRVVRARHYVEPSKQFPGEYKLCQN